MSLDSFKTSSEEDTQLDIEGSEPDVSWGVNWHIKREGYWESVDEKLFSEDSPNKPPIIAVPDKLAADMEIIEDEDVVEEVAEYWFPSEADRYVEVLRIRFNDFSTWNIPLPPWERDYAKWRENSVKRYLPEIIKWKAIVRGEDVAKVLREWEPPWELSDPEWFEDIDNTDMDDETRKWFNQNASWLPHMNRTVESNDVELEIENDGWEDDW